VPTVCDAPIVYVPVLPYSPVTNVLIVVGVTPAPVIAIPVVIIPETTSVMNKLVPEIKPLNETFLVI